MFKEMRRSDRASPVAKAEEILTNGEYGTLATTGENGYPYAVPMNYLYQDGCIYLHSALQGHKIDNIGFSSKVSFCVVGKHEVSQTSPSTLYESVILFGLASLVEGQEKMKVLTDIHDRYRPECKKEGRKYAESALDKVSVIKINVERLTGKGNAKK